MSFELHGKRTGETDNAVCVVDEDGKRHWFPFSQVESTHFDRDGKGSIIVSDWIAEKEGLTEK